MTLRDYQLRAIEGARRAIEQGKRSVLIVLPTGAGKTRTAAAIAHSHLRIGGKGVLFVAPRAELVQQARSALGPDPRIHVRTIQGLNDAPEASLVILDEARHYVSDEWSKVRDKYPHAIFIGLDATPERQDGRGLGSMFEALVVGLTVKDAIAQGYLVPPDVIRPERALDAGELAQDPVDAYNANASGTKAIGFFPSVALAREAAERFGPHAAAVWGEMPSRLRAETLAAFHDGRLSVLTCANLLTEGFDEPAVETVILARRFGSAGGYLQAVGRGLRLHPGKTRCLVLDLVGAFHVHGAPDEERTYHLDGKAIRRAQDDASVRWCPVCGACVSQPPCDECGHAGEMRMRKPRILGLPISRFAALRKDDEAKQAARLAAWLRLARAKGWRDGQAMHRFKGAYGTFPSRQVLSIARAMAG